MATTNPPPNTTPAATTPPPPPALTEAQKKAADKKAAKLAAAKAATDKKAAKQEQNGVTRPAAGTKTGQVWDIADQLSKSKGSRIERKHVIEEALKLGLNESTAATQYGRWMKFYGFSEPKAPATPDAAVQAAPTAPPA